jgi:Flp pilus assembly protein CpaB
MHTALFARGWRGSWVPGHLRRRLLAAALAAAAALIGLSSLHRPATPIARSSAESPSAALLSGLRPGQVATPIRLVDPGVAPLLHPGATVDVLAAPDSPDGSAATSLARVIAQGVRLLAVTAPSASETSTGTLVVLAVSRADAQALAGAEAGGRLSVTLEAG